MDYYSIIDNYCIVLLYNSIIVKVYLNFYSAFLLHLTNLIEISIIL